MMPPRWRTLTPLATHRHASRHATAAYPQRTPPSMPAAGLPRSRRFGAICRHLLLAKSAPSSPFHVAMFCLFSLLVNDITFMRVKHMFYMSVDECWLPLLGRLFPHYVFKAYRWRKAFESLLLLARAMIPLAKAAFLSLAFYG